MGEFLYGTIVPTIAVGFITFYITSNFYINKYESIINKNNIEMVQKEADLRRELSEELAKATNEVSKLEMNYQDELSRIEEEYANNSNFIIDSGLFEPTTTETNSSNLCGSTLSTSCIAETKSGIVLSKTDARDFNTLAKEADGILNELNLCKTFIRKVYEANKMPDMQRK